MKRLATAFACALIAVATAPGAHSQQDTQMATLQDYVRDRIVFLVAEGQDKNGVPSRSEATGFFVNELGNILTVYHLLTKLGDIDETSIKIEAHIGSKNSPPIPVVAYADRQDRDLLLLDMADDDAGKPLCTEPNYQPDRLQRPLFTTGFSSVSATISQKGDLTSPDGPNGTWLTDIDFIAGQSGSPVYEETGKVIGVAKGQLMDGSGQPVPGNYVIIPIADAIGLVNRWSAAALCYTPPVPTLFISDVSYERKARLTIRPDKLTDHLTFNVKKNYGIRLNNCQVIFSPAFSITPSGDYPKRIPANTDSFPFAIRFDARGSFIKKGQKRVFVLRCTHPFSEIPVDSNSLELIQDTEPGQPTGTGLTDQQLRVLRQRPVGD